MSYATIADMQSRFSERELIELTDRDGSQNKIVTSVLEQALEDATNQINGYLSGRYQLPLNPVPKALIKPCCDLARYSLYDREATEHIANRHAEAVRYFKLLAEGKVTLGIPSNDDKVKSENLPQFESAGTVFSRPKSKAFI